MTHLQLAGVWYVFIGLVWGYLVLHEYVTNGSYKKKFGNSGGHGVMFVLLMFFGSAVAWPVSVWACC